MLSRLLPKPSHLRSIIFNSSKSYRHYQSQNSNSFPLSRFFSTGSNNGNNDGRSDQSTSSTWKISQESDGAFDELFSKYDGNVDGIPDSGSPAAGEETWLTSKREEDGGEGNIFEGIEKEIVGKDGGGGENEWGTAEGFEPWSLVEEDKIDVFGAEGVAPEVAETRVEKIDVEGKSSEEAKKLEKEEQELTAILKSSEEAKKLEKEEQELTAILKGPTRAFGDLITTSGITDEMLDSLIALKDLEGVEGLPPLSVIEDLRYEKNTRKSSRAEIELQKQEEFAKSRVRQVDDKGRSYGTGRRKCSIARVWVQPGDGKFIVNDKEFDVYFPMLDSRAALLRPFSETKTLGLWDVKCTVKGGGTSGQVGAIRLGISRALQNWEPDLRPSLRDAGFLTRDSRVVERKKPGKAKARKSFQWVKR